MLVVLTIIGLLAAILLPVFANARERGRTTTCQNNLRQIAVAFQLYLQDDGGVYPLVFAKGGGDWTQEITPYIKNKQVFRCPDLPSDKPLDAGPDGYGYDFSRLNVFLPPYPTKNVLGASESSIAKPATTWLNSDPAWSDQFGDHYVGTGNYTSCGGSPTGSIIHSGGGNYSFVDGHVRWLTPEQMGQVNCADGPPPAPFKN